MKSVLFIIAVVLAFFATFIMLAGSSTDANGRGRLFDINFFAGAFFFYLLSQASFISG